MTTQQLIKQLITEGGAIVSSNECSVIEISDAQCKGRFAVDDDGMGFVRRYKEWLEMHRRCRNQSEPDLSVERYSLCNDLMERNNEGGEYVKWEDYSELSGMLQDHEEQMEAMEGIIADLRTQLVHGTLRTE